MERIIQVEESPLVAKNIIFLVLFGLSVRKDMWTSLPKKSETLMFEIILRAQQESNFSEAFWQTAAVSNLVIDVKSVTVAKNKRKGMRLGFRSYH